MASKCIPKYILDRYEVELAPQYLEGLEQIHRKYCIIQASKYH